MKRLQPLLALVIVIVALLNCCPPSDAAIVGTGNLLPADPASWDSSTSAYIGQSAPATLDVDDGSNLATRYAYIGAYSGSSGAATLSDSGTTWDCANDLTVGLYGDGSLAILQNASATVGGTTWVSLDPDGSGNVLFDGTTLSTGTLAASPYDLDGTGTITARGLAGDFDVVFDSPFSQQLSFTLDDRPGQNIAVNVDMSNPTTNGRLGAGFKGRGSVTIRNGATITSNEHGNVGYQETSHGTITVDGGGSAWINQDDVSIGRYGHGTLNISGGATVTSDGHASVAHYEGSTGKVSLDGSGSQWSVAKSIMVGRGGDAIMTVTGGADASAAESCNLGYSGGSGRLVVSGSGSTWTSGYSMHLGYLNDGHGELFILDGGHVENEGAIVNVFAGSTAKVVVRGAGSTWNNTLQLHMGRTGSGTMLIDGGGLVTSTDGTIGKDAVANAHVLVCGANSRWTASGDLEIAKSGNGALAIANGGAVSAATFSLESSNALLAIDVSGNSRLTVGGGSGTLTSAGTVRVIAGAAPTAGASYSPISAGAWSTSADVEAIGGAWNSSSRTFTASSVVSGSSGSPISTELSSSQRIAVTDLATGWGLGTSLRKASGFSPLTLTATAISGAELAQLDAELNALESVLGGWLFSDISGYGAEDPAHLSFEIGSGYSRDELQVWEYDGGAWTELAANDLVYDGTYASFSVAGLTGYAVTTLFDSIPGDANGDGFVDDLDAARLAANWGLPGGWAQGDFDGDGQITMSDASILAANWGQVALAESSANVPEPGTIGMLMGLGLALIARRRRGMAGN